MWNDTSTATFDCGMKWASLIMMLGKPSANVLRAERKIERRNSDQKLPTRTLRKRTLGVLQGFKAGTISAGHKRPDANIGENADDDTNTAESAHDVD